MRLLPVKRISLFLYLTCSQQVIYASDTVFVKEAFSYELLHTDVACWRDGECSGLVAADAKGAMAESLDRLLASAEKSIDAAIYGVYRQDWFLDTLSELRNRKIKIRAVVDQARGGANDWAPGNFTYPDTSRLPRVLGARNVSVDTDPMGKPRSGSIMHNKFFVIDQKKVWLGSTNISNSCLGAEYNVNNTLIIESPAVAEIFANEFVQMFAEHRFSVYKQNDLLALRPPTKLTFADGTHLRVFFSPQDDPMETAILPFIHNAKETLDIAMFYMTDTRVGAALQAAVERGVRVRVILDALGAAHPASIYSSLIPAGVSIRVENLGGKMHMKSAIADGSKVLIGSMNWTVAGAVANDENLVVIENNPSLANEALHFYEELWRHFPDPEISGAPLAPAAEGPGSINSCFDGIDNDHDGLVDLEEPRCRKYFQNNLSAK